MNKKLLGLAVFAAFSMSAAAGETVLMSAYDGNGGTLGGWGGSATFESVTEDGKPCLKFTNPEAAENSWNVQLGINGLSLVNGTTYYISFDVKGDAFTGLGFNMQNPDDGYKNCGNFSSFNITTSWANVKISADCNGDGATQLVCSLGAYVGTCYITNFKLYTTDGGDTPAPAEQVSILSEVIKSEGNGFEPATPVDGVYSVNVVADPAEAYSNQLFVVADQPLAAGTAYTFSMKVKSTSPRKIDIQAHTAPGTYKHWSIAGGSVDVTADWTEYKYKGTVPAEADGFNTLAFSLSTIKEAGVISFKDIVWTADVAAGVEAVEVAPATHWTVYNLQGMKVLDTDNEAAVNELKSGIYVVNGKKIAVRR